MCVCLIYKLTIVSLDSGIPDEAAANGNGIYYWGWKLNLKLKHGESDKKWFDKRMDFSDLYDLKIIVSFY